MFTILLALKPRKPTYSTTSCILYSAVNYQSKYTYTSLYGCLKLFQYEPAERWFSVHVLLVTDWCLRQINQKRFVLSLNLTGTSICVIV